MAPPETGNEKQRPPIPDPMKRAVRQRCGFGCVVCGHPLFEYHHIEDYSIVQEHAEDNLTLLCDSHHREATNGLLSRTQVAEANHSPKNVREGISRPFALHFSGTAFAVEIGTNEFSNTNPADFEGLFVIPISIDDIDIVSFMVDKDGRLFLNMSIFDECNLPLLLIRDNWLVYRRDAWDIEFVGRKLTVRQAHRNIFLELEFCPPDRIRIVRGRILCNGLEVMIRRTHIFIVNNKSIVTQTTIVNTAIGLQLGRNDRCISCAISSDPASLNRYGVDLSGTLNEEKRLLEDMGLSSEAL